MLAEPNSAVHFHDDRLENLMPFVFFILFIKVPYCAKIDECWCFGQTKLDWNIYTITANHNI